MKQTKYLMNPGRLSRQDNTLKFTPVDENGLEGQPRFLPVEQVSDLYVFGSLDANSAMYNFLASGADQALHVGQKANGCCSGVCRGGRL